MAFFKRQFGPAIATKGLLLLLLPAAAMSAQNTRLRGVAADQPPAPVSTGLPGAPSPAVPQSASVPQVAPSMLQQPAHEAQIVFAGDTLSIHADNSSLAGILHQFAAKSGMRIEGLSGDERVFGTFGPGAPRDVLADLLNGTSYNLVLLGDLSNGAPRQLILTPSTHGAAAASPSPQVNPDEATADQEPQEVYVPEVPTPLPSDPPAPTSPGVRTPQQLFEQLQRMRQNQGQQQQTVTPPDDQQQEQAPQ
jgi:hypothetical protein